MSSGNTRLAHGYCVRPSACSKKAVAGVSAWGILLRRLGSPGKRCTCTSPPDPNYWWRAPAIWMRFWMWMTDGAVACSGDGG